MVYRKRVLALALAASLVFGTALSASAATSPTTAVTPTPTPAPTATPAPTEPGPKDHTDNTVEYTVSNGAATVTKITADNNSEAAKHVILSEEYDTATKKYVPVTAINANVFNSAAGRKVTTLQVTPSIGKTIVIKKGAFNKSKVKKVTLNLDTTSKVIVKKNAFKTTKKKKVTIVISAKKASQVTAKKGAFNKLSKKSVIKVKKTMSKKEFKKLKKKLRKAGFKGKIKRA